MTDEQVAEKIQQVEADWKENELEAVFVPKAVSKARMEKCKACEHFWSLTRQCGICKCFMPAKTKLLYDPFVSIANFKPTKTTCPDGRW